jgi:predicted membrane protein
VAWSPVRSPQAGLIHPRTRSAIDDTSSTFKDSAFMGSVERRNVSQTFRGGHATAFMGGVEIDLRDARMASTEALVVVSVMMGSVELRIPRDWTVESRVSATLGSFEDLTTAPVDGSAKRFVVQGSVFMGSVEIRN